MSNEVINPDQQFLDATGQPLASGTIAFNVNLISTLGTIYSDEALTIAQANPYTLDASGRITGDVKFSGKMRMVQKDRTGAVIRTKDNVTTLADGASITASIANQTQPTYAALRTALAAGDYASLDRVSMSNLATPGVNGAGTVYAIGSYTDDGGYIITSGSFAWVRDTEGYIDLSRYELTGLSTQDVSPIITLAKPLIEATGAVLFPPGFARITSGITFTRSVTMLGLNKSGNGYNTVTAPNRAVILKDFDGVAVTFDGSSATATGTGGGLDGIDFVQYYGSAASSNPSFVGGSGTAVKITGTTTDLRASRLKIDNCSLEQWNTGGDMGNDWLIPLDIDGSGVGGSDGVRNNWVMNMRIVTGTDSTYAARIYNAFNVYMSNVQLDSRDATAKDIFYVSGPDAAGESANVNLVNCVGHLQMDFVRNITWTGGRIDTVSSTADTSDGFLAPRSINVTPTALPGCSLTYQKADRSITRSDTSVVARFGQDDDYAATTDITGVEVGNLNDDEGALALLYRNGASQEVIVRANLRNNADSANANMAEHRMTKNSGVDTADHIFSVGGVDTAKFDDDATAGNTRFLIYDVDNATLERVSVGAADSGGTGYKLLRILN